MSHYDEFRCGPTCGRTDCAKRQCDWMKRFAKTEKKKFNE